jgi:hypothetical protein
MKTSRPKTLQLAGIELVLPTVLRIDGRQARGARTTLTVGYATGYVDTIVAPLVAEWLSRRFRRRFAEHGRGPEGDLAAEAFYDKLASHFRPDTPFLAAIVSRHDPMPGLGSDQSIGCGSAKPRNGNHRHADALSRFISGAGMTRWTFAGTVHAFVNPKTGAAQVAFEPLPGGIELINTDKLDPSTKVSGRSNETMAWYGFGVPVSDPADIVLKLRNQITTSRHTSAPARRAAHA